MRASIILYLSLAVSSFGQQAPPRLPPQPSPVLGELFGGDNHGNDISEHAVYVEPWETLVQSSVQLNAGQRLQWPFPLTAGTKLLADFKVQGGLNNRIDVHLLDLRNWQLYSANRPYQFYSGTSGAILENGGYRFTVPKTDLYYLVLDNSRAWLLPRTVKISVDAILPAPTRVSEELRRALQSQYMFLKRVFVFDDFRTFVVHCGFSNAFSSPDITLCVELFEDLGQQGVPAAMEFVYLHELGHTLMKKWGLPLWDNEDAADEFATALLLLAKQDYIALQSAQWWASQNVTAKDAAAKIYIDDRHSLSPQRARNVIRWIGNRDEIVPRWLNLFVPHMQTAELKAMLSDPETLNLEEIRKELSRRDLATSRASN